MAISSQIQSYKIIEVILLKIDHHDNIEYIFLHKLRTMELVVDALFFSLTCLCVDIPIKFPSIVYKHTSLHTPAENLLSISKNERKKKFLHVSIQHPKQSLN